MSANDQFVKHHFTQVMVLAGVAILSLSFVVVSEDTDIFYNMLAQKGEIKGAAIEINIFEATDNEVLKYQDDIINAVNDFLLERAQFDSPHKDWLFLIDRTRARLLKYDVPARYKKVHVDIITTLDKEREAVYKSDNDLLRDVNNKWGEILDKYFWLNRQLTL